MAKTIFWIHDTVSSEHIINDISILENFTKIYIFIYYYEMYK